MYYQMKYLVIGSGGREHAIIKSLLKHNIVDCMSDKHNPGISGIVRKYYKVENIRDKLIKICKDSFIDIVVIGPEKLIADGLSDLCLENSIHCIAPSKQNSQIETSKSFARRILREIQGLSRYNPYILYDSEVYLPNGKKIDNCGKTETLGESYTEFTELVGKVVIKYDGLCQGKGVFVQDDHFNTFEEGLQIAEVINKSDDDLLIEEKLEGNEFSLFSFCDGIDCIHSPPICDYKRAHENDMGPNTGGMGSISVFNSGSHLFDFLTDEDIETCQQINEKVITYLGDYKGILYGSFIKTKKGIKVIEFNCRFGDSEAINVLELLETDLGIIFEAIAYGSLNTINVSWKSCATTVKYIVPSGYPSNSQKSQFRYEREFKDYMYVSSVNCLGNGLFELGGSRSIAFIGTGKDSYSASKQCEERISEFLSLINDKSIFRFRKDIGFSNLLNYKSAGVNIDKNDIIVNNIKPLVKKTYNKSVVGGHGDFGGQFRFKDAILVSSTDGVGTKSMFAYKYFGVNGVYNCGVDIVNHCINDILVMGAFPLFFLDYYASSNLSVSCVTNFVHGCADACRDAGCVLMGGETAEMPGIYRDDSFDLVGTMIGEKIVTINSCPDVDDIVIYFESSGPHTNGYSLIRKCVEKYYPDVPRNVMCELSQPHRNYLSEVRKIHELSPNIIKGMCHITGGGVNNINRILDDSLCIHSEVKTEPDWCQWIREKSHMSEKEMYETFNMGIGFLVIIDKNLFTILENNSSDVDYKYYGKVSKKKQ